MGDGQPYQGFAAGSGSFEIYHLSWWEYEAGGEIPQGKYRHFLGLEKLRAEVSEGSVQQQKRDLQLQR